MKTDLQVLYQTCFGDSDAFTEFFFRTRGEHPFKIEKDGKIACELFMTERTLAAQHGNIRAYMLSGACTHPSYRKRGLMSELMMNALAWARENGADAVILNPFNDLFYTKFGFFDISFVEKAKVTGVSDQLKTERVGVESAQLLLQMYRARAQKSYLSLHRTLAQMEDRIEEMYADGGFVDVCKEADSLCGYLLFDGESIVEVVWLEHAKLPVQYMDIPLDVLTCARSENSRSMIQMKIFEPTRLGRILTGIEDNNMTESDIQAKLSGKDIFITDKY